MIYYQGYETNYYGICTVHYNNCIIFIFQIPKPHFTLVMYAIAITTIRVISNNIYLNMNGNPEASLQLWWLKLVPIHIWLMFCNLPWLTEWIVGINLPSTCTNTNANIVIGALNIQAIINNIWQVICEIPTQPQPLMLAASPTPWTKSILCLVSSSIQVHQALPLSANWILGGYSVIFKIW